MGRDDEVGGGKRQGGAQPRPWRTVPVRTWGWPRKRLARSICPISTRRRMYVELTVMPPTSTLGMMSQPSPSSRHFFHQQLRGALVLVTEVVVVARHQVDGVIPAHQNVGDEVVPGVVIISWSKGTISTSRMPKSRRTRSFAVLGELMRDRGCR